MNVLIASDPEARRRLDEIKAMRAALPSVPEEPVRQMTECWSSYRWSGGELDALAKVMACHPPEYVLAVVDDICRENWTLPPSANVLHARLANFGLPRGRLMSNGMRWKAVGFPTDPVGTVRWEAVTQ